MRKNLTWLIVTVLLMLLVLCGCSCEHEYGEWKVVTPSTCTAAGTEERVCTKCNEKETREAALLSHAFGEWNVEKEATCGEVGAKNRTCSVCQTVENQEIPKLAEHSYGEWTLVKESTCTEKGSQEQTCAVCNHVNTEAMDANGHVWQDATCATPKTCSVCNAQEGAPGGHTFDANGICTICNTENPKLTELKETVTIYGTFLSMNSVGGVHMYITWENESTKDIKYITFTVQLYNKVNDPIACEIRKNTKEYLQQTGPIPQGKGMYTSAKTDSTGYSTIFKKEHVTFAEFREDKANGWAEDRWENVWYNSTAHYAKVIGVDIEYMDGSRYSCQDTSLLDCVGTLNLNRNQYHNDYA